MVQRGEVDQPAVEVLHLGAVLRDLVDEARKAPRDAVDLRGRLGELRRRDAAAVAADLPLELLLALERGHVLVPGRDKLLDEGPHLLELGVRLLGREVTHGRTLCCAVVEAEAAQPRPSRRRPPHLLGRLRRDHRRVNYAARVSRGKQKGGRTKSVYSYSTFAGGTVFYAVWLGIVLLICIDRFDLLALRRPRSWGRHSGSARRHGRDPRLGGRGLEAAAAGEPRQGTGDHERATGSRSTPAPSPPTSSSSP